MKETLNNSSQENVIENVMFSNVGLSSEKILKKIKNVEDAPIKLKADTSENVEDWALRAIELSKKTGKKVMAEFGGITYAIFPENNDTVSGLVENVIFNNSIND